MSTAPDPAPPMEMLPPPAVRRSIGDLRILVVEDHGFQRWALGSMLKTLGVRVVFEAEDGGSALELLSSLGEPADVVLADLDMPGMDGMELMRHVGETRVPASVILMSGLHRSVIATAESMAQAYGVHVLGTIEKPVEPGKLERLLLQVPSARRRDATTAAAMPGIDELVHALDHDEFEAVFQPIVETASGKLRCAEALARWHRPGAPVPAATVAPDDFIRPLEQTGNIERLTLAILAKALDGCRRWRAHGVAAGVSVNLSSLVLADVSFAAHAESLVRDRGLEPRDVVFEITETGDFPHLGKALENLSRLRVMGFGLAIDDYGIGYASPKQLGRIAFNQLKIDRSFVGTALRREASLVILESSIEIARRLGMVAVAEGVESREEWELLVALGCDRAQGYWVARPMSAEAFIEWASKR